jgi:prepilin-type N-terminal cleavage/methylation domain-containing protein
MMKRGFSLIELLVVVAIIAILVGVATPYYADYVRESKRAKALQDLDVLKQAVVLYNSQEDFPYLGVLSTDTSLLDPVPVPGENDFNGLQGRYLTYIPVDPWGKNYKLDPYACFVYSEGPTSNDSDDIRDYYIKDLALVRVEWEDSDNDRTMNSNDLIYFHFNKPLCCDSLEFSDFQIYENNELASSNIRLGIAQATAYSSETNASSAVLITTVDNTNSVKLGVHSLCLDGRLDVLRKYKEVRIDRKTSTDKKVSTIVDKNLLNQPIRYAIRTNPIKITPK